MRIEDEAGKRSRVIQHERSARRARDVHARAAAGGRNGVAVPVGGIGPARPVARARPHVGHDDRPRLGIAGEDVREVRARVAAFLLRHAVHDERMRHEDGAGEQRVLAVRKHEADVRARLHGQRERTRHALVDQAHLEPGAARQRHGPRRFVAQRRMQLDVVVVVRIVHEKRTVADDQGTIHGEITVDDEKTEASAPACLDKHRIGRKCRLGGEGESRSGHFNRRLAAQVQGRTENKLRVERRRVDKRAAREVDRRTVMPRGAVQRRNREVVGDDGASAALHETSAAVRGLRAADAGLAEINGAAGRERAGL